MKKLLLLTLAIATLTSMVYSQTTPPIQRGGIIVYEKDGHGLVAAPTDLKGNNWMHLLYMVDAKYSCDTLTLNGYSDWRLPSKEELNSLYEKKNKIGGFKINDYYWSSTVALSGEVVIEGSTDYRWWAQHFWTGQQIDISGVAYARAVRTF